MTFTLSLRKLLPVVCIAATGLFGCRTAPEPRIKVVESPPMRVDRIYHSMQGPITRLKFDYSDLDWITALTSEIVDAGTDDALGGEFFCHAQLQLPNSTRLMVMATGIESLRFPRGFGMPLRKILDGIPAYDRQLTLLGMALNNHVEDLDVMAKVRWTFEYWRDEDLGDPPRLKTLFKTGLGMTVDDLEAYEASEPINEDVTTHCVLVDGLNVHWVVPPGPQITRRVYPDFLPVDATVHYAVVHLHNYGEYMRLRDVTTGELLWQANAEYDPNRPEKQIVRIAPYSSETGFKMFPDHKYEIEAYYDNTTDHDIDAMAMMYLYFHPVNDEIITYPEGPDFDG